MDYKATLNLPKTDFPMKANLPQREPELWPVGEGAALRTHSGSGERPPRYVLHDGPPYANGRIHIGHALNKILKDIIIKSKTMAGYQVPYVPGWDCHGLPIEHQVLKELATRKGLWTPWPFASSARSMRRSISRFSGKSFSGWACWATGSSPISRCIQAMRPRSFVSSAVLWSGEASIRD